MPFLTKDDVLSRFHRDLGSVPLRRIIEMQQFFSFVPAASKLRGHTIGELFFLEDKTTPVLDQLVEIRDIFERSVWAIKRSHWNQGAVPYIAQPGIWFLEKVNISKDPVFTIRRGMVGREKLNLSEISEQTARGCLAVLLAAMSRNGVEDFDPSK
jgi:hypothetical protein